MNPKPVKPLAEADGAGVVRSRFPGEDKKANEVLAQLAPFSQAVLNRVQLSRDPSAAESVVHKPRFSPSVSGNASLGHPIPDENRDTRLDMHGPRFPTETSDSASVSSHQVCHQTLSCLLSANTHFISTPNTRDVKALG